MERTEPFPFSGGEALDLGDEHGSLVTTDYGQLKFSGEVHWVELEAGIDDHSHLIKREDRINRARAVQ